MKKQSYKKAFTFIEVMVVLAIIAIMAVATLLIMNGKGRGQQEVQTAGRLLESDIRSAQNNALNGVNGTNVCGYGVSVAQTNGTITKYHLKKEADGSCDSITSTLSSYYVSDGVDTISNVKVVGLNVSSGDPYVFFSVPFGAVSDNASGSTAGFQFNSNRDATTYFSVCVYGANRITDGLGTVLVTCP